MAVTDNFSSRDQSRTLSQNYRRLGLTSRLRGSTGGAEKSTQNPSAAKDPLAIAAAAPRTLIPGTVRVERAADGSIIRVIHPPAGKANPLNDPLNELSSESEAGAAGTERPVAGGKGVVPELEKEASQAVPKRPRQQSKREEEWVRRLVDKHGDGYASMARDGKLNPMQQSEGDIRRRVKRWRESVGGTEDDEHGNDAAQM